ncbi:MAG: hypothetical protein CVT86_03940, partial [Alphaproteobacteria bacterium HGW-Alphaproteobacteria-8]
MYVIAQIWTDYAWYRSLGQESVFMTRIVSQAVIWFVVSAAAFSLLCIPALAARHVVGRFPLSTGLTYGGSTIFALLSGWNMSQQWMVFRMAISRSSFGTTEPQFGQDAALFVFRLPALELVRDWLTGLVVLSVLLVLAVIFLPMWAGVADVLDEHWGKLKSILMRLLGTLMLSAAFSFWVSIWGLALSNRTAQTGASYTDVHAQIPANWILAVSSVVLAITLFATSRSKKWVVPVSAFGAWVAIVILAGNIWPAVVQNYVAAPNEATVELPYIERNIS